MKKYIILLILSFSVINFSCKKNSGITEGQGTLRNYTGFDGCGYIIESDSGKKFELHNIPTGFTLINNKKVSFKYKPVDAASVCMVGEMIEIISIEYI